MNTKRYYGIDILRIFSMLGVVLLHMLGAGGVLANSVRGNENYFAAWFLEIAAMCSVNVFAAMTGFLYGRSKRPL